MVKIIDGKVVEKVEEEIGMGAGAWDMEDPKEIIQAAVFVCTGIKIEREPPKSQWSDGMGGYFGRLDNKI